MELEVFLKTFLDIEKIEPKEDGSVVLHMLLTDSRPDVLAKLTFEPDQSACNISQLSKAIETRYEFMWDLAN